MSTNLVCAYCRRPTDTLGRSVSCKSCDAVYCSSECQELDLKHMLVCYHSRYLQTDDNKVDVIAVARAYCRALGEKPTGTVYRLLKHSTRGPQEFWRVDWNEKRLTDAELVDKVKRAPILDWRDFAETGALGKNIPYHQELHRRFSLYMKGQYARRGDQLTVDLVSILLVLQARGKVLTFQGMPIQSVYYVAIDMTKSNFPFRNPKVFKNFPSNSVDLVQIVDVFCHTVIGLSLDETGPAVALDLSMCVFDLDVFGSEQWDSVVHFPLIAFGLDAISRVNLADNKELQRVRDYVAHSIPVSQTIRNEWVSSTLLQIK